MSEIQRITDQLKRSFGGGAWHGPSVLEILNGVTVDHAAAKPLAQAHSIWEIVLHITGWMDAIRQRITGKAMNVPSQGDWPAIPDPSEAAWQQALTDLKQSYTRLLQTVSALSDLKLEDKVPGRDHTVYFSIHGIIQHNLYHAGQIALLKKSQR